MASTLSVVFWIPDKGIPDAGRMMQWMLGKGILDAERTMPVARRMTLNVKPFYPIRSTIHFFIHY